MYRLCTYCQDRRASRHAAKLIGIASRFVSPTAVLITCPSSSLLDLPQALRAMHTGLGKLRRRRWFANRVRSAVLAFELPLTEDQHRWALHAHGVLDLAGPDAAFYARCEAEWCHLVGIPGAVFAFERLRSLRSFIDYALKVGRASSWSPTLGELSPNRRAHLDQALRGRRMTVTWGML
jgi:hypothetical protein